MLSRAASSLWVFSMIRPEIKPQSTRILVNILTTRPLNSDSEWQHLIGSYPILIVEAWWFLLLSVFGRLSSSLLLFAQRFGRYVLRPSSGVCQIKEPTGNFEPRPLLNPRGSPVLIPLAITSVKYSGFVTHLQSGLKPENPRWLSP